MWERTIESPNLEGIGIRDKRVKTLKEIGDLCTIYAYDPKDIKIDPNILQYIIIYPPPLFIMSPRIKVYDAKSIKRYEGYLKSVTFGELEQDEQAEATITITVSPEDIM